MQKSDLSRKLVLFVVVQDRAHDIDAVISQVDEAHDAIFVHPGYGLLGDCFPRIQKFLPRRKSAINGLFFHSSPPYSDDIPTGAASAICPSLFVVNNQSPDGST